MKRAVFAGLILLIALPLTAGTRLTYRIQSEPVELQWPMESFPLRWTVDGSVAANWGAEQIRRSFSVWERVEGTAVRFDRAQVAPAVAGRDGINSVTLVDEMFAQSAMIAFTTAWFDDQGTIQEADVQVDVAALEGFEFSALLTHELGHALGLDHSGVLSSAMYPFVGRRALALDTDDELMIRAIYPLESGSSTRTVTGVVRNSRGPVFGAQVVAIDAEGRPAASGLTGSEGRFRIEGLPPGDYEMVVEPLDGPVEPGHLSGVWRDADGAIFPTAVIGAPSLGKSDSEDLVIQLSEAPVSLNPKWIGVFDPTSSEMSLDSTSRIVRPGSRVAIAVGGEGIVGGLTTFEASNQAVRRVSEFRYGINSVSATFEIARDSAPGSLVVFVRNGEEIATLSGALQIAPSPVRRRAATR